MSSDPFRNIEITKKEDVNYSTDHSFGVTLLGMVVTGISQYVPNNFTQERYLVKEMGGVPRSLGKVIHRQKYFL